MSWLRNTPIIIRTLLYVFFVFGLNILLGMGGMYIYMTLTKEKVSFVNIKKVLESEGCSEVLRNEQIYHKASFQERLQDCKLKLEDRYNTTLLITEQDFEELPNHNMQMYICLIDSLNEEDSQERVKSNQGCLQ